MKLQGPGYGDQRGELGWEDESTTTKKVVGVIVLFWPSQERNRERPESTRVDQSRRAMMVNLVRPGVRSWTLDVDEVRGSLEQFQGGMDCVLGLVSQPSSSGRIVVGVD